MEIHGTYQDQFSGVIDVFNANFQNKGEIGASFAATVNGEFVVDIWGGHRDSDKRLSWERDTIVNVYSSTKTMTFLVALMLYDRGLLDLDAPVAKYWPDFAQNGKENVLVKHVLSHSAGLPGFENIKTVEELFDWEACVSDLAVQAPWWEPGTQCGYHAISQGYLIGEIVRRITGESIGQWFSKEVAAPLGADFYIGMPASEFGRAADLIPGPDRVDLSKLDQESFLARVLSIPVKGAIIHTDDWRSAEIPAANGYGNARSIAKVQSLVANGGTAFGKTLLSQEACRIAAELQMDSNDLVLGIPMRYCMGYAQVTERMPYSPSPHALFWAGAGGSFILVDMERKICCSYVMNKMGDTLIGDERAVGLIRSLYDSLSA